MAKRRRLVRPTTPRYAPAPPTGTGPNPDSVYGLVQQAVGNADQWWTGQGSPPPTAHLQRVAQMPADAGQGASAYGSYNNGELEFSNDYLARTARLLENPSLKIRRQVLAQMWGLAAHERGHNIGYGHDRGGIMNPDLPAIPGQAYVWAAQMLPNPKLKRRGHLR